MKDKVRKKNDQINIEMGIESPLLEEAMIEFKSLFIEMNEYLGKNTWLAGDKVLVSRYLICRLPTQIGLLYDETFMERSKNLDQWYEKLKQDLHIKKQYMIGGT